MERKNIFRLIYLTGTFLILALPLLNVPPFFSPPDWGKTILFRSILSILVFTYLFQFLFKKESEEKKSLLFLFKKNIVFQLLFAFWGIFLISTLFSKDFTFSMFGNPYRSGGFLNLSFLIIFPVFLYFVLKKKDWQKIWDFSIIIGILVSTVAIFQQFGIQKEIFIFEASRPPSTIGITSALAIYLLILSFPTLSFFLSTSFKKWFKKIFYFLSLALFLSVSILITQTRSAYIGFAIGFLFFAFFFPLKKKSFLKSFSLKAFSLITLFLILFGVYFANTSSEIPELIKENEILNRAVKRLSIERALEDPRLSGWPVFLEAIKERPLLGYGPENFSLAFDKHFDPSLPRFQKGGAEWWDRAHNIFLDLSIQAGVISFLIYLALIVALMWQLQRTKRYYERESNRKIALLCHGFQASILGYFTANIFSFDVFSTYLLFFLIIGNTLYFKREKENPTEIKIFKNKETIISAILLIILIVFLAEYNLKPFYINTQINIAMHEIEGKEKDFQSSISIMEENIESNSILNNYLRLKYISVLGETINQDSTLSSQTVPRAYQVLKEASVLRPKYTRTWFLLGKYTNYLYLQKRETEPQEAKELLKESNQHLQKAIELSPKRQQVLVEWSKTKIYEKEYQESKEISQKCIDYNPELRDCYWQMALSNIYLQNEEEFQKYFDLAKEKRYNINSEKSLLELVNAYIEVKNYEELITLYQKLLKKNPDKIEYHTSLAVCYKETGDIEKARKEALKVLEMSPESKESVVKFLQELNANNADKN
jgi:O-antigen ligase/tetratricopeptide (TPR) repeat protein